MATFCTFPEMTGDCLKVCSVNVFTGFSKYRRRGSNPHMELPIPDFESGASAIPPLRRYLNCLRWCRRRRRLIDANSIRKVLGLCEDSESGCETAKSVQMESPWGQRCQNSMIKAFQSLDIGDSIDGRHGLRYFSTSLKVEPRRGREHEAWTDQ